MEKHEFEFDTRLLRLFLTVYETGSVTIAATRLGLGQPAVSHGLEKLRRMVGDPLFVRAGRGISPTAHADDMAIRVRTILDDMRQLARIDTFDPDDPEQSYSCTIGTSEFEGGVILPALFRRIGAAKADIRLKVLPVRGPDQIADALRKGTYDLAFSLEGEFVSPDLACQTLFGEHMLCFYDADFHECPPDTLDRYCAAGHARVVFKDDGKSLIDDMLARMGRTRRTVLEVTSFDNIPRLIRGTPVIATLPSRLGDTLLRDMASCPCPLDVPSFKFCQLWHVRNAAAGAHRWLRGEVFRIAKGLKGPK